MSETAVSNLNKLRLRPALGGFSSEFICWGYFSGADWWRNYLHIHSFFEVCYVYRGKGTFRLGRQTFQLTPGDLFIARPGERHEIVSDKETPLGLSFWAYTLTRRASLDSPPDLRDLLTAFAEGGNALIADAVRIADLLQRLTDEADGLKPGHALVTEGLSAQLIVETARLAVPDAVTPEPPRADRDALVSVAERYLRDNYHRPLKLKEVAAQVGLSERHLGRRFKAATGESVKTHLLSLRPEAARQLLLSGLSVSEVAYRTGYLDARYFSTVFKCCQGLSPTAYREQGGTTFPDG